MEIKEREWLTPMEFVARNRGKLGRNLIYSQVKKGRLLSVRVGNKIMIASDALDRLLESESKNSLTQYYPPSNNNINNSINSKGGGGFESQEESQDAVNRNKLG